MANKTVNVIHQQRAATKTKWASDNPILLSAEIGIESDTGMIKIGNGTSTWNSLQYIPISMSQVKDLQTTLDELENSLSVPDNIVLYEDPTGSVESTPNVDADRLQGSTKAELLNRTSHTGSQAISTINGLQTALDAKSPTNHTHQNLQDAIETKSPIGHLHGNTGSITISTSAPSPAAGVNGDLWIVVST